MFKDGSYRLKPAWMLDDSVPYPELHDLSIEVPDGTMQLFHPAGDDPKPAKVVTAKTGKKSVAFTQVNVTLPIVFLTQGDFRGAVELPWNPKKLAGNTVTATLTKRPTSP